MFNVNHIFCGYNNQDIIKDISFDLEPGCNLSIIGPNGCGKSTLLKALAHIIPYKGSIRIDNTEIKK